MIVCTASKGGREPKIIKFLTSIEKKNLFYFIEPQDLEKYKKYETIFNIIDIKENDKGFGYLMNFINEFCLSIGEKYYIFIDDDVTKIMERKKEKTKELNPEEIKNNFLELEKDAIENNFSQLGLCYINHRFDFTKIFIENFCFCVFLNNAQDIKDIGGYDIRLKIFSDSELSARLMYNKKKCAIKTNFVFVHQMGKNKGGSDIFYKNKELSKEMTQIIINKIGKEFVKEIYHEKYNMFLPRFSWSKIRKRNINQKTLI
jgi:hypothetical protein